jgi:hypothetical protein
LLVDPQATVVLLLRMTIEGRNASISFPYPAHYPPTDACWRIARFAGPARPNLLRRTDDGVPWFELARRAIPERHDGEKMSSPSALLKL